MSRILWIEDEAYKLKGLIRPLVKEGHQIDIALTMKDAFTKLDRLDDYDLVLLDMIIPEGDDTGSYIDLQPYLGISVLKEIRRREKKHTPVIILTVVSDEDILEEAGKMNVDLFLQKGSLLPSELRDNISTILGTT